MKVSWENICLKCASEAAGSYCTRADSIPCLESGRRRKRRCMGTGRFPRRCAVRVLRGRWERGGTGVPSTSSGQDLARPEGAGGRAGTPVAPPAWKEVWKTVVDPKDKFVD